VGKRGRLTIKKILIAPFVWLIAFILVLEDWLWEPLLRFLRSLAKWRFVRFLEKTVGRLPPYGALLFFTVPIILLFPFKFLGLYLIAHGEKIAGLTVFIVAKVVGTGMAAWVYSLTEPALSKLAWFVALRTAFTRFKASIYERVKTSITYRFVRRRLSTIKVRVKQLFNH
jgi:hypothetical protein